MNLKETIIDLGRRARRASKALAQLDVQTKNSILISMADELLKRAPGILEENFKDITENEQLSDAMTDRLRLTQDRIKAMSDGIRDVADLPDPVGKTISSWTRPNGLQISKVRVPIGVIGIIYESRPNVTSDAAVLCIKTSNATILRGGSESIRSNIAIAEALQQGGAKAGLPADSILLVSTTDRDAIKQMAGMDQYIDMIIPRGGSALIETVMKHARMPVIKHYHGVCHTYVERKADLKMADRIVVNAKCQRPGVCNAMETLLVDREIASEFLKKTGESLFQNNVELRGDDEVRRILGDKVKPVTEEDWTTEYLNLTLSVKVVDDLDAAIDHIEKYGSHHSDCIVTEDARSAEKFLSQIDSATVYWNASTRFTDGAEFGFGAEIGISTDKLHARGPMALEELTTYKYIIRGSGQIRG